MHYRKLKAIMLSLLMALPSFAQKVEKNVETLADQWEYQGIAINEPGYHVWGSSPIKDEKGHVHLFAARWKIEHRFDPGWRSHSEIAHYVADHPQGPFRYVSTVLQGTGKDTWDKYGIHNPTIHRVGDKYVLLYIGNDGYNRPPHPSNQKIGMMVADNLNGPWRKVGKDGCILAPSTNPKHWTYKATNGVNNPALLQHPKGGFLLYFKSEGGRMGVAFAEHVEGPYVMYPEPVTHNDLAVEDGYAFSWKGNICLLTTDNHGILNHGGGVLWTSHNGITFDSMEAGYYPLKKHIAPRHFKGQGRQNYGKFPKFERPQVLMENGSPQWLFVPSGCNIKGENHTIVYVMKRKTMK